MFAAVRIRGSVNMNRKIKDTLAIMNLKHPNNCVLLEETPSVRGMLKKAENWITWGEVSKEVEKGLKEKCGEGKVFRLPPPSKGYKSVKIHFPKGALGYRREAINDLLKRMI